MIYNQGAGYSLLLKDLAEVKIEFNGQTNGWIVGILTTDKFYRLEFQNFPTLQEVMSEIAITEIKSIRY